MKNRGVNIKLSVKSNKGISRVRSLLHRLEGVNYDIVEQGKGLVYNLEFLLLDNTKKEIVIDFVTYQVVRKAVNKNLEKGLGKEINNWIPTTIVSPYYFYLTRVLVSTYLENNSVINIDSFLLFNIHGFDFDLNSEKAPYYKIKLKNEDDLRTIYEFVKRDSKVELMVMLRTLKMFLELMNKKPQTIKEIGVIISDEGDIKLKKDGNQLRGNKLTNLVGFDKNREVFPLNMLDNREKAVARLVVFMVIADVRRIIIYGNGNISSDFKKMLLSELFIYGISNDKLNKIDIMTSCESH